MNRLVSLALAGAIAALPVLPLAAQHAGHGATAADPVAAAIAAPTRTPANVARDPFRHPAETLAFFGVTPKQTVVEWAPSGGWYTEILAPLLRDQGHFYALQPTGRYLDGYRKFLAEKPQAYDLSLIHI